MIQSISFNTIYTRNCINNIPNRPFNNPANKFLTSPSIGSIVFKGQINYVSFDELMQKFLGILTKDDYKKISLSVKSLIKIYNGSGINNLLSINNKNVNEMLFRLKTLGVESETTGKGTKFNDNTTILNKLTKKQIKQLYIKVLAVREIFDNIKKPDPLLNNPTIKSWFKNLNYNSKRPNLFHSLYIHPIEKAKFLIGEFSEEEQKNINKNAKSLKQKNISILKIEKQREIALNKVNAFISVVNFSQNEVLSNLRLDKLRKNLFQYEVLDKALSDNKIFSKEIEAIVANSVKKLSTANVGDFVDDIGLIVQKTTVYDKNKGGNIPCIVIFNKEKKDFSFKLIKIDYDSEERISEFAKKYENIKRLLESKNQTESQVKLDELKNEASQILESEKNIDIAKVHFNIVPIGNIKGFLAEMRQPEKIEKLIEAIRAENSNISKIPLVIDFINFNPERYSDAGKKVVLPLIHLLKEHNCNNIVMKALAMGENKKSPLPMYLHAGFKPISPSEEEIAKVLKNHQSWDPKIPVYMYLPNDSMINEFIEKKQPLREIFNLKNH